MTERERDARVSAAYRQRAREEPPVELDAVILAAARQPRRRWAVPVSIAAVVVLAVGVTLRLQLEPPEEDRTVARPLKPTSEPARALRERRAAAGRLDAGDPSAAAKLAAEPESPERWLERIATLREAGKHREADESLAEFRRRHPDFEIPAAMRERVEPR